jgi:hypothetical protein
MNKRIWCNCMKELPGIRRWYEKESCMGIIYGTGQDGCSYVQVIKSKLQQKATRFEYKELDQNASIIWGEIGNKTQGRFAEHYFPVGKIRFLGCQSCPK